jgi:hypothetical protein
MWFKGIVQPKKRKRGSRGVSIDSSYLPAQSLTFFGHLKGYFRAVNLKKPVSAFIAKKR